MELIPDEQLIQLIEVTSKKLGLENSVIEKDYYATRVIRLLSTVENEYFRLIFAGGTYLAKAHKIVQRMSEDVILKFKLRHQLKILARRDY